MNNTAVSNLNYSLAPLTLIIGDTIKSKNKTAFFYLLCELYHLAAILETCK